MANIFRRFGKLRSRALPRPLVPLFILFMIPGCSGLPKHGVSKAYLNSTETCILNIPFEKQEAPNRCGLTCLSMVMHYWNGASQSSELNDRFDCPSQGFSGGELRGIAEKAGYKAYIFRGRLGYLYHHLQATRPIIVILGKEGARHYYVAVGYSKAGDVVLADPATGLIAVSAEAFTDAWKKADCFSMLVVPASKAQIN